MRELNNQFITVYCLCPRSCYNKSHKHYTRRYTTVPSMLPHPTTTTDLKCWLETPLTNDGVHWHWHQYIKQHDQTNADKHSWERISLPFSLLPRTRRLLLLCCTIPIAWTTFEDSNNDHEDAFNESMTSDRGIGTSDRNWNEWQGN
jgi:hypothetical protein